MKILKLVVRDLVSQGSSQETRMLGSRWNSIQRQQNGGGEKHHGFFFSISCLWVSQPFINLPREPMKHVKNFCLREKVLFGDPWEESLHRSYFVSRYARQNWYQALISPSPDPTSKKRGANGEMEESVGKVRDRRVRGRANKPPWALYAPLAARAWSPRNLFLEQTPKDPYTFTNWSCACCAHTGAQLQVR